MVEERPAVYVIEDAAPDGASETEMPDFHYVKIGITEVPSRRKEGLMTTSPYMVRYRFIFYLDPIEFPGRKELEALERGFLPFLQRIGWGHLHAQYHGGTEWYHDRLVSPDGGFEYPNYWALIVAYFQQLPKVPKFIPLDFDPYPNIHLKPRKVIKRRSTPGNSFKCMDLITIPNIIINHVQSSTMDVPLSVAPPSVAPPSVAPSSAAASSVAPSSAAPPSAAASSVAPSSAAPPSAAASSVAPSSTLSSGALTTPRIIRSSRISESSSMILKSIETSYLIETKSETTNDNTIITTRSDTTTITSDCNYRVAHSLKLNGTVPEYGLTLRQSTSPFFVLIRIDNIPDGIDLFFEPHPNSQNKDQPKDILTIITSADFASRYDIYLRGKIGLLNTPRKSKSRRLSRPKSNIGKELHSLPASPSIRKDQQQSEFILHPIPQYARAEIPTGIPPSKSNNPFRDMLDRSQQRPQI